MLNGMFCMQIPFYRSVGEPVKYQAAFDQRNESDDLPLTEDDFKLMLHQHKIRQAANPAKVTCDGDVYPTTSFKHAI